MLGINNNTAQTLHRHTAIL